MTTKITLDIQARTDQFCIDVIGRTPSAYEVRTDAVVMFFSPSLTATEKTKLNNALPEFVKKFWVITIEEM